MLCLTCWFYGRTRIAEETINSGPSSKTISLHLCDASGVAVDRKVESSRKYSMFCRGNVTDEALRKNAYEYRGVRRSKASRVHRFFWKPCNNVPSNKESSTSRRSLGNKMLIVASDAANRSRIVPFLLDNVHQPTG